MPPAPPAIFSSMAASSKTFTIENTTIDENMAIPEGKKLTVGENVVVLVIDDATVWLDKDSVLQNDGEYLNRGDIQRISEDEPATFVNNGTFCSSGDVDLGTNGETINNGEYVANAAPGGTFTDNGESAISATGDKAGNAGNWIYYVVKGPF